MLLLPPPGTIPLAEVAAGLAEVDDRESIVRQPDLEARDPARPRAFAVGAAMVLNTHHAVQRQRKALFRRGRDYSSYPAHEV